MLGTFFTICYFDTLHGAAFTREVNPPPDFFLLGERGQRSREGAGIFLAFILEWEEGVLGKKVP